MDVKNMKYPTTKQEYIITESKIKRNTFEGKILEIYCASRNLK